MLYFRAVTCLELVIKVNILFFPLLSSTAADEMCNFYMMYYRNASSHITTPESCGDQFTYKSLSESFPNGSDVALNSIPGHHHHHHHSHQSGEQETGNKFADLAPEGMQPGTNQGRYVSVILYEIYNAFHKTMGKLH